MAKIRLFAYLIAVAMLFSCHEHAVLDKAEAIVQDAPDSALVLLQNVQSSSLRFKGTKARYALLYSIALDKCYIDIQSDSIISEALSWYSKYGNKRKKMLANYYAGKVEYNAQNYSRSVNYAHNAREYASTIGDGYYEGLADWLIADIYYLNNNYVKARDYYSEADDSYSRSGKELHASYSKCEVAKTLLALKEYHDCDSLLAKFIPDHADPDLGSFYYSLLLRSKSLQEDDNQAIAYFWLWDSLSVKVNALEVYGEIANSFNRVGDSEMARACIQKAYSYSTPETLPIVSSFNARLLYDDGEYKQAIDSLRSGFDYQNEVALKQFSNSIDDAYSEIYRVEADKKVQRANNQTVVLLSAAILVLLLAGTIYYFRKKEYLEKINAAKADIAFVTQLNQDKLRNFNKFLLIKQNMIDDIFSSFNTEKTSSGSVDTLYDIVDDKLESLKSGGDGFKKLVKDLNACFDDIVRKLRERFPDISRQDYLMLVYYFGGFSQETVSTLMGIPVQKLYNLKRNWVNRFRSMPSPDRELFLSRMLPSKMD